MTARPADAAIAARLRELGKTRECVCEFEVDIFGNRFNVALIYDYECPVHFPETSRVLRGDDD